jgi:hypothetical protein
MENISAINKLYNQTDKYFEIINKTKHIEIHSHKSKDFIFTKDINNNNYKTTLHINLIEKYNKEYNISYFEAQYTFINYINEVENNQIIPVSHPFYNISEEKFLNYSEGFLVVKNNLTDQLIKYLFMDDSKLEKQIGNSSNQKYRFNILTSLAEFWD